MQDRVILGQGLLALKEYLPIPRIVQWLYLQNVLQDSTCRRACQRCRRFGPAVLCI